MGPPCTARIDAEAAARAERRSGRCHPETPPARVRTASARPRSGRRAPAKPCESSSVPLGSPATLTCHRAAFKAALGHEYALGEQQAVVKARRDVVIGARIEHLNLP